MGIQIQRDKYFSGGGGTMPHEDPQKSAPNCSPLLNICAQFFEVCRQEHKISFAWIETD